MKQFLTNLRNVAIAGFLFLLPAIVILVIITKAWTALSSVGAKLAAMFGMTSIMGLTGTNVLTGILLIAICIACGLLVRLPFISAFNNAVERFLKKYIPGYETYRTMAEDKLQAKTRHLPYAAALIRQQEYWTPAYVVEQDPAGNCVVFVPAAPDTSKGHVLLAHRDQLRFAAPATANQVDASLRSLGKGLLGTIAPAERSGAAIARSVEAR